MKRGNHLSRQQNVTFFQPCIVGYMSVDGSRNYCPDISLLKFVTSIPRGKVSWDLNHNLDRAEKRTTDNHDEKLDILSKFLLHESDKFNLPINCFITLRATMISIMYSAFNITEPICIRASLFKNKIYIKNIQSETEKHRRETSTEFEKKCRAWGYKFEQYLLSDEPNLAPDVNRPVVENEEFSLVCCSQIGDHKLLYGAQTDGALANSKTATKPNTTNVQEIVQYLRSIEYLELKTNKEIRIPQHKRNFMRYKMLWCWCQCYLANYKGLLVGFRDDFGVVQRLQWFDTAQIPEYCKIMGHAQTSEGSAVRMAKAAASKKPSTGSASSGKGLDLSNPQAQTIALVALLAVLAGLLWFGYTRGCLRRRRSTTRRRRRSCS